MQIHAYDSREAAVRAVTIRLAAIVIAVLATVIVVAAILNLTGGPATRPGTSPSPGAFPFGARPVNLIMVPSRLL